ncbi:hypothetical protein DPMN_121650 [Dreissena polymorpha]|uniref:Uncharacterized protein n=1 Tax=Dreissena polymorpha TaxID=45954 RepID=A0A9D4JPR1_DREPO|nr:hypothetical protein DPMN_121650 [Dreissena polymorpha]
MKYELNKIDTHWLSNAADQIITLEELTKTSSFVQTVKHLNGFNHRVITLFNSQQIRDIKRFCCENNGKVLGMDKTFNLWEFHVTPTVDKDISVVNRSTGESPICFEPKFIHTYSTTKAYSSLFTM